MKKLSLVCLGFAFFVTSAFAQAAPGGGGQGTQNSSPSTSQPRQDPGMTQPNNNSYPSAQTDQGNAQSQNAGEKKLKGCVQSQGGQYVLETKKGKTVALAGQDVSAHVGHEVAVKGTWESGTSSAASTGAGGSEKTFNVTKVDMISETCSGKNMGHSGSMDHSSQSTGSSGTGNSGTTPPRTPPQ
jgi:Protein of unknown function (DUF5818)